MGFIEMIFGKSQSSSGYYQEAKQFYQVPGDQIIHKTHIHARDGFGGAACERVTTLNARSGIQWVGSLIGVCSAGLAVFVFIALVKKDEKFDKEVVQKIKKFVS